LAIYVNISEKYSDNNLISMNYKEINNIVLISHDWIASHSFGAPHSELAKAIKARGSKKARRS
jgi:beta-N-acetylglucosaminidase